MDWIRLFTVLAIAVFVTSHAAEGTRKKIRIHIPQKVKHIHHHKKIYIRELPATAQYAPAFLPTAEAAVAIPTTVALPSTAVAGFFKTMPLYEERRSGRLHGSSSHSSPVLPLYRARGYYGPTPSWERPERDVDLQPPPLTAPSGSSLFSPSSEKLNIKSKPKRIKVIRIMEKPKNKKTSAKKKPKRIIIQDVVNEEGEPPMPTFYEQFYADVDSGGTIRKIKKPKRVEKIIDGDTEHIHTFSEEHIHKVVYDDMPKLSDIGGQAIAATGLTGTAIPTLALANQIIPNQIMPIHSGSQSFLSVDTFSNPIAPVTNYANPPMFSDLTIGSMGTPAHLEYMGYNPRDVTHDHMYHEHGEVGPDFDFKQAIGMPMKTIPGHLMKKRPKNHWVPQDNIVQSTQQGEYSFYENLYSGKKRPLNAPIINYPKKTRKLPQKLELSNQNNFKYDDNRPSFISNENVKFITPKQKPFSHGYKGRPNNGGRLLPGLNTQITGSSAILHDAPYKLPKPSISGLNDSPLSSYSSYKDSLSQYKDMFNPGIDSLDSYSSSNNQFHKDIRGSTFPFWKNKSNGSNKKSISTQNINFGGQDHKMVVDHMADSSDISQVIDSNFNIYKSNSNKEYEISTTERIQSLENETTPPEQYTLNDYNPTHDYYSTMAFKAFKDNPIAVPDSVPSNSNYEIVEAPPQALMTTTTPETTTMPEPIRVPVYLTEPSKRKAPQTTASPQLISTTRLVTITVPRKIKPAKKSKVRNKFENIRQIRKNPSKVLDTSIHYNTPLILEQSNEKVAPTARGKLKYGDRLNERYDNLFGNMMH